MRNLLLAAALCLLPPALAQARPLVPAEQRIIPYTGKLPACDDPGVLARISSRFHQKEHLYWDKTLEIAAYDRIGEQGLRSNGRDYIPRRYCKARATLNNGAVSGVTYSIGEDLGIIGWGYGVDSCLVGYDRSWSYGSRCDALEPIVKQIDPPTHQIYAGSANAAAARRGRVKVTAPEEVKNND